MVHTNVEAFLFGSILTVTPDDVLAVAVLCVVSLAAVYFLYPQLVMLAFDEDGAKIAGVKTRLINYIIALLVAAMVAVSIRVVGILVISSLIALPVAFFVTAAIGMALERTHAAPPHDGGQRKHEQHRIGHRFAPAADARQTQRHQSHDQELDQCRSEGDFQDQADVRGRKFHVARRSTCRDCHPVGARLSAVSAFRSQRMCGLRLIQHGAAMRTGLNCDWSKSRPIV